MERVKKLPRIPTREPDSHKGTYGRVLLILGSPEMPGAAVLAARAALRCGSGLVTVAIPRAVSAILGAACPEATQLHLPPASTHRESLFSTLRPRFEGGADAVAVGPGLGTSSASAALVGLVLDACTAPVVLDADALNVVAAAPALAKTVRPDRVWTPHPGEFQRLTGERPRGDEERVAACARFVARLGGVVVLKGHRTVVLEEGRYHVNETGNPGMATGGSGDVLTGVIASLLGQGFAPFDAACLGVFLHGSAGDAAAEKLGQQSLIAGDIVEFLPKAFERLGSEGHN